ncbi:MAG: hypothetical protein HY023_13900 [Chloroflexi bacterium]|nr:hypothetical protein [Chloroflexota bacterium]
MIDEFARALGRPVEYGKPTSEELCTIEEVEGRLTSDEWLSLHANGGKPMNSLKISRGVFIRAIHIEVGGCKVRAALRLRDEMIDEAVIESEPERDWRRMEAKLRGMRAEQAMATLQA